jgi:hypothetical protein
VQGCPVSNAIPDKLEGQVSYNPSHSFKHGQEILLLVRLLAGRASGVYIAL